MYVECINTNGMHLMYSYTCMGFSLMQIKSVDILFWSWQKHWLNDPVYYIDYTSASVPSHPYSPDLCMYLLSKLNSPFTKVQHKMLKTEYTHGCRGNAL